LLQEDGQQDNQLTVSQKVTQQMIHSMQNSLTEIRRMREQGGGEGKEYNPAMIKEFYKR
jgi:hypothetical protein